MVYCRLSRIIPLYHEDFKTKITTIDDFSYSINVINKLLTLEQELVIASYESEYERMQKELEKEKEITAMTITHIATELASVSEKQALLFSS